MTETPIVFVTFNRPDSAARSFESIRKARPKTLFLVSDAARGDRVGEADLVERTRRIGEQVDWPCDVHRMYATENLGCARRISSAISKALEIVDRLIILEDDCIAHHDFYDYCDALLDRYADDERVMAVFRKQLPTRHETWQRELLLLDLSTLLGMGDVATRLAKLRFDAQRVAAVSRAGLSRQHLPRELPTRLLDTDFQRLLCRTHR